MNTADRKMIFFIKNIILDLEMIIFLFHFRAWYYELY